MSWEEASTLIDAIVVPGGGSQRDEQPSSLPPWTRRRLDAAIAAFCRARSERCSEQGPGSLPTIVLLSAGTTHRPTYINQNGWPVQEATSAALYILETEPSIPAECILREATSLDTIGNAYFLRTQHTDVAGWRRLLIITSEFHMPRTAAVFRFVFNACHRGLASPDADDGDGYKLTFTSVSDEGLDIGSRVQREAANLVGFRRTVRDAFGAEAVVCENGDVSFASATVPLSALHKWLFSKHLAYCTHPGMVPAFSAPALSKDVLDTY